MSVIYIINEDLLYKSICRMIYKPLKSLHYYVQFYVLRCPRWPRSPYSLQLGLCVLMYNNLENDLVCIL